MPPISTACSTMSVRRLTDGAKVVINVEEFDSERYEKIEEVDVEASGDEETSSGGKKSSRRKPPAE